VVFKKIAFSLKRSQQEINKALVRTPLIKYRLHCAKQNKAFMC